MKKVPRIIATAALAGAVFASTSPSAEATAEATNFMPIYAKPTSEFPFTDVPEERMEDVLALYQNKFLNGVSTDQFGWSQTIKRVDAAMVVARGMGFRKEQRPIPEKWLTFKDVPDRAKQAIAYLQFNKVVNGKTETVFGSNDTITRGEAAIILSRAYADVLLSPTEPVHHFTDATGRYAKAINKLVATGITHGKTSDRFGTNDPVKRGEFAIMVARLSDPALSPPSDGDLPSPPSGITMKADKESYSLSSDTGISLTIVNKEDFPYGYRYQYTLEKKQGDKWLEIRENRGILYPTDVPQIEAGKTMKVNVSFGRFRTLITAGEYRIMNTFGVAEFTITY
ncbi:S-layer homology domain-containing protein [Domibacillus sp. PGB-M46]|uniref:S-layer homology domain-containing protein n=1 Tax=Domibacillus sp. PGB-M46 TaxID=2910255 RepID=UPI001F57D019|nr:S-layer homology domain-containing protein [Domibacillus sp. PGB-M46]MCI2254826.1 S-layer homology domain-containing protein [Domibacillus sp. PGB-M46]